MVQSNFLAVPKVGRWSVIVAFRDHTHLLSKTSVFRTVLSTVGLLYLNTGRKYLLGIDTLLNVLSELGKRDKMRGSQSILSLLTIFPSL